MASFSRTRYETLEVRILPVLGRGPTGGAPASAGMVPGRVLGQLVHSAASSMPAGGEENIVSQMVMRPRVETYSSARVPLACRRVALCNRWGTQLRGGVRIRWPHIISATYSLVAPCRTRTHWHSALYTLSLITLAASLRRIVHAVRMCGIHHPSFILTSSVCSYAPFALAHKPSKDEPRSSQRRLPMKGVLPLIPCAYHGPCTWGHGTKGG